MKTIPAALLILTCAATSHAQQGVLIREKAKGIAANNNAQQAAASGGGAAGATTNAAKGKGLAMPEQPQLTADQRALVKLILDLDGSRVTAATTYAEKLWDSVHGVIRGPVKPGSTLVTKLSDDLAAALAGKPASKDRSVIAKNLEAVLNNTTGTPEILATDTVALLKKSSVEDKAADTVGADLKAIAADLRKKSAGK